LTGPALRIRDPRSDNYSTRSFSPTLLATTSSSFLRGSNSGGKSAGHIAKASLPFLSTTHDATPHGIEHTLSPQTPLLQRSTIIVHQAAAGSGPWTPHWAASLAPTCDILSSANGGVHDTTPPGFAKPLTSTCFNSSAPGSSWLTETERGSTHATTPCNNTLHGAAGSRPGRGCRRLVLRPFYSSWTLVAFTHPHKPHLEDDLCVYPARRRSPFPPLVCYLLYFYFYSSARVFVGWPVFFWVGIFSATASLGKGVGVKRGITKKTGRTEYTERRPHHMREPRDTITIGLRFGLNAGL
jgi:hypothetical protein